MIINGRNKKNVSNSESKIIEECDYEITLFCHQKQLIHMMIRPGGYIAEDTVTKRKLQIEQGDGKQSVFIAKKRKHNSE